MKRNNNGFALIESLLIILILVIISFGGYYVWHTQKTTDKVNSDTLKTGQSTPTSDVSTTQKYLEIKEYGVKFKLTDKISDAYYVKGTSGNIYLSLRRFDNMKGAENCKASANEDASGILALITAKLGEDTGAPAGGMWTQAELDSSGLTKVGDTYFGFQRGNAPCWDVDSPPSPNFIDTFNGYIQDFTAQIPTFIKA